MRDNHAMDSEHHWGFRTRAIHAGAHPEPITGARAVPIFQTTSYVFEDTADAADLFALQKYGNVYSPHQQPDGRRVRGAHRQPGRRHRRRRHRQRAVRRVPDHQRALRDGRSRGPRRPSCTAARGRCSKARWPASGHDDVRCAGDQAADFAAALQPNTKLIYTEVVANPSGAVADLEGLAAVAHGAGIPLVVDSTVATPYLCRPIEWGADIVVHSATKFLGGHGTSLGGVVVESGHFDWGNGNFPRMTEPVASYGGLTWWGNFGEYAFCTRLRAEQLRDVGPDVVAVQRVPADAGRRDASAADGRAPRQRPRRCRRSVREPGRVVGAMGRPARPSSPPSGARYLPQVRARCSRSASPAAARPAARFIEALELCSHLANIGDIRTLVIHPASTTHRQLSDEALVAGGVPPDLIRISVGLEDADDIVWDIEQALEHRDQVVSEPVAQPRQRANGWRSSGRPPRSPSSACRPTRAERATSSPPTCCRRAARSITCGSSTRKAARSSGSPVYPLARRPARRAGSRRRVPQDRRPAVRGRGVRGARPARGRSGHSSGCTRPRRSTSSTAAGRTAVMNRCLKIEHARFRGGLHLAGFDTGMISSKRRSAL